MEKSNNTSDNLLLIVVIWMFLSRIFWAIIPKLFSDFYSLTWFKIANSLSTLVWASIPFLIAFIIKEKNKQLVVFIIASFYLLYSIYEIITQFMMDMNF